MSIWYKYHSQFNSELENLYQRKKDAEDARPSEYKAAVKIQSWYRGNKYRAYLKYLNNQAGIIQKHWRGFIGKNLFRAKLKEAIDNMCWQKFTRSAVVIQCRWRGYRVRKYEFDYYEYRKKLIRIQQVNENTLNFINNFKENQLKEEELNERFEQIQKMKLWAEKNHHLISTHVQPGIYNSPFLKNPSIREQHLKCSEKTISEKMRLKQNTEKKLDTNDNKEIFSYDPAFIYANREYSKHSLPPISSLKPQGPFRDPIEVQAQRYRPLNPSLRVMTDFYSLEKAREVMKGDEWTKRLHDEPFLPVLNKEGSYQPLLITSTEYGAIPYGTVHFREVTSEERSTKFKSVIPPIQIFEKVNKQYVENYSI